MRKLTLLFAFVFPTAVFAASNAPEVLCFLDAQKRTSLKVSASIDLCSGANSNQPVDCFLDAQRDANLTANGAFRLCSPRAMSKTE